MKKSYSKPVVELSAFESENIITASTANTLAGFGSGFTFSTEDGINSINY